MGITASLVPPQYKVERTLIQIDGEQQDQFTITKLQGTINKKKFPSKNEVHWILDETLTHFVTDASSIANFTLIAEYIIKRKDIILDGENWAITLKTELGAKRQMSQDRFALLAGSSSTSSSATTKPIVPASTHYLVSLDAVAHRLDTINAQVAIFKLNNKNYVLDDDAKAFITHIVDSVKKDGFKLPDASRFLNYETMRAALRAIASRTECIGASITLMSNPATSTFHNYCGGNQQIAWIFYHNNIYYFDFNNFFAQAEPNIETSVLVFLANQNCFKNLMALTGSAHAEITSIDKNEIETQILPAAQCADFAKLLLEAINKVPTGPLPGFTTNKM